MGEKNGISLKKRQNLNQLGDKQWKKNSTFLQQ